MDGPRDAAANMARDEVLLKTALRGGPPTLRLYRWSPAALSVGAHQPATDVDLAACRGLGVDLVRRPTGGGAVLHDAELTYAVAARRDEEPFPSSVVGVYDLIATALVGALSILGIEAVSMRGSAQGGAPPDCFGRASAREIVVDGRKLVGSAQLRRGPAFLQHGSMLIDFDGKRLVQLLPRAERGGRTPATLRALLGQAVAADEIGSALVESFARELRADFESKALDEVEEEEAARLRAFRYLDAAWTLEGKAVGRAGRRT